jgi:hypothetical protein
MVGIKMNWKNIIKNKVPTLEETGAFDGPWEEDENSNEKRFERAVIDLRTQHKDAQHEIFKFVHKKVPSNEALEELNRLAKSVKGMIINVKRLERERDKDSGTAESTEGMERTFEHEDPTRAFYDR